VGGPLPFDVAPWSIGLIGVDVDRLAHRESVFSLANGNVGWRGDLDEGDPHGVSGSYLNGVFEEHPMPYAEDGYGYPDSGQSVVAVPNGQILRLTVDDEPFDVRRGKLVHHEQRLDFRSGALTRIVEWVSPRRRTVRITSTRLVSLTHRAIAAVAYSVEAVDAEVTVTVQSEILANEPAPEMHPDPRVQEVLARPFESVGSAGAGTSATLVHRTRRSGIGVAVSMDHVVATSDSSPFDATTEASADLARTTLRATLAPGERLELVKYVGHEWSDALPTTGLRDRAEGAVADAVRDGWDELVRGQRARLDDYWACADVEIDGQPRLQQAVRFALFHVFQSAARAERRSAPGKGLTGIGYAGHTFWDFEAFVIPVLTSTAPEAAEQALRWRFETLDHARERARALGLDGAAFAWRTIDGRESSGYWPASTAAFHVNAAIAHAVLSYIRATGDEAFEREAGLELLVETARLWMSLGRWDSSGGFHIDGVTGPDEYSAIVDDNVYTNVMAQLTLRGAVSTARRLPDTARALDLGDEEIGRWASAAAAMTIPFDTARDVHQQSAGFTERQRWSFETTSAQQYPLQDHFPYFDLYRKQVVKQADLVLALYFAHESFTAEEKARAFDYYERITVRDSSLSAAVQAVIAAETGHVDLAADYLAEAATLDLDDLQGDTAQGIHLACLAGTWTAITAGFGGMRDGEAGLRFAPRLPARLTRLRFGIRVRERTLHLEIAPASTVYTLSAGSPLELHHFGERIVVEAGQPTTALTPPLGAVAPRPPQPEGRAPRRFDIALGTDELVVS